jgi:hypothetical protein
MQKPSVIGESGLVAEKPYSPLDRINLARSVELTLLQQPCHPFPLPDRFSGAGLYALYYQGDFTAYKPISSQDCQIPIYVGKAMPAGARTGLTELDTPAGPVLFNRLRDHWKSIEAAVNLDIADFRCRHLVVEDIFISMGEAILIQHYQPLWNGWISGFGLHDPGSGRHGSERSQWDELHPGRSWYPKMRQVETPEMILERLTQVLQSGMTATIDDPIAAEADVESAEVSEAPLNDGPL